MPLLFFALFTLITASNSVLAAPGDVTGLAPSAVQPTEYGGWGTVAVTTAAAGDTAWNVTGLPSWLRVIRLGGNLVWRAAPNTGIAARTASLQVGGAVRKTLTVTQAAASAYLPVQVIGTSVELKSAMIQRGGSLWTMSQQSTLPSRTPSLILQSIHPSTVLRFAVREDGVVVNVFYILSPEVVSGAPISIAAVAGENHNAVLTPAGTVWIWGVNTDGQLGDGSVITRQTPAVLSGLNGVVMLAVGAKHTLALKDDGTVVSWGSNANGQLGDGTSVNRLTPAAVPGLAGVVAISAGPYSSFALLADGTVKGWGANDRTQISPGASVLTSPTPMAGLSGIVEIAAGGGHLLARRSDGTVWAQGDNSQGQLGDGTRVSSSSPVAVQGLTAAVAIAASALSSHALQAGAELVAWGDNELNQLGDGTTTDRLLPTPVFATKPATLRIAQGDRQSARTSTAFPLSVGFMVLGSKGTPLPVADVRLKLPDTGPSATFAGGARELVLTSDTDGRVQSPILTANALTGQFALTATCDGVSATVELINGTGVLTAVSAASASATAFGGSGRVPLTTAVLGDTSYRHSGGADWLILFKLPGAIYWRAMPNTSGVTRTATVTLGEGSGTFPFQVTQTAAPASWFLEIKSNKSTSYALAGNGRAWAWGATYVCGSSDQKCSVPWPMESQVQLTGFAISDTGFAGIVSTGGIRLESYYFGTSDTPNTSLPNPLQLELGRNEMAFVLQRGGSLWYGPWRGSISWESKGLPGWFAALGRTTSRSYQYLALGRDGTLWNFPIEPPTTPFVTIGLHGVVAAAEGPSFSLALRDDGTVWAWGRNSRGNLGDGTTTERAFPVPVVGLTGVVAVAAGYEQPRPEGGRYGVGVGCERQRPTRQRNHIGSTHAGAGARHQQRGSHRGRGLIQPGAAQ
jgi:alpha-tubulin suppressor-like RCC1 family protein